MRLTHLNRDISVLFDNKEVITYKRRLSERILIIENYFLNSYYFEDAVLKAK